MFSIEMLLYKLLEVFAFRLVVDLNEDNCVYFFSIINLVVSVSVKVLTNHQVVNSEVIKL